MKSILIIYQVRVREYDNALLLKAALEQRGYRVDIMHDVNDGISWRRYDLILSPYMYDNHGFEQISYRFNARNTPILNLRYEQVTVGFDIVNGYMAPHGKAQQIMAVNWGTVDRDYCLDNGHSQDKLRITGHLSLDFLRPEFSDFWMSRSEIAKKYDLPEEKPWFLFISSFGFAGNQFNLERTYLTDDPEFLPFARKQETDRAAVVEWLKEIAEKTDYFIIYRPHPSENIDVPLFESQKNAGSGKFRVILDQNVKQWIVNADLTASWISTAIVECYIARKMCFILRPNEIGHNMDPFIYWHSRCIRNSGELLKEINEWNSHPDTKEMFDAAFPIRQNDLLRNYDIQNTPSFERIIAVAEELLGQPEIDADSYFPWLCRRWIYLLRKQILLKFWLKRIYQWLHITFGLSVKSKKIREKYAVAFWETEAENRVMLESENQKKLAVLRKIVSEKFPLHHL